MREFLKKNFPALIPVVRYVRGKKNKYLTLYTLKSMWKLAVQKSVMRTSISDDGYYPLTCYLASKNDEMFANFKRNYIYNRIIECTGEQEKYGAIFLELIEKMSNFNPSFEDWQEFAKNDLYGNPRVFPVKFGNGKINLSSTTIRYVKILGDIMTYFDTDKIKSIAEIGVGYGGLCRILMKKFDLDSYTLFDLPEVLGLTEKFLSHYDECSKNIRYIDGGHIYINDSYDFFMSHYAFTELRRDIQDMYLEKVILKSKRGYITWNEFSEKFFGGYSVDEFMRIIPGASRIEINYNGECLVVWGNK